MNPTCSIIIPSWNNPQFLNPCVNSIIGSGALSGLCELIIVNNGSQPIAKEYEKIPGIRVIESGKNLGWEGGLALGLEHSKAPFVCFQNDDTQIPFADRGFYQKLLIPFQNEMVAAVGPATTCASGWHSIFMPQPVREMTQVSYLIFFTVMIRRSDLDAAGGIDTSAPGGDDFDLSIRFRNMGKKLLVNPDAFIIHHGFKSGERLRGTPDQVGGWNSKEMTDETNRWLIQKHGFRSFFTTKIGLELMPADPMLDKEGDVIRQHLSGKIVELACGAQKTIPEAIGVDRVPAGELIPHLQAKSVADIVANIEEPLPIEKDSVDTIIGRHILEHCIDPIKTVRIWAESLKEGGRLILAVPFEGVVKGIPLNPEHVHAFNPRSLRTLMEACGFKHVDSINPDNGISFVGIYEKLPVREMANA